MGLRRLTLRVGAMKADPADCFGIGEDAGLVGFVLARVGIYGSLWGGRKITTTWL